jgi:hypothetical protein
MSLIRLPFLIASLTLGSLVATRADVVISEFVANNNTGHVDDDGDRGDWIELYNNGSTVENLSGWRLTDDAADPTKWVFPGVTLEPKGFLIVFASSKDRTNSAAALHTNFKLSADGGYLALVRANGTLATEFNPYPAQYDDRPYGYGHTVTTTTLISPTASLKYLVPTSATPDNPTWTARTFNDTAWTRFRNHGGRLRFPHLLCECRHREYRDRE